ncbi:hypothetical protein E4U21_003270 [Claviceps maximensis]|nr:hypothetical protein E4U21_003270 [Claviceps maximensis]
MNEATILLVVQPRSLRHHHSTMFTPPRSLPSTQNILSPDAPFTQHITTPLAKQTPTTPSTIPPTPTATPITSPVFPATSSPSPYGLPSAASTTPQARHMTAAPVEHSTATCVYK